MAQPTVNGLGAGGAPSFDPAPQSQGAQGAPNPNHSVEKPDGQSSLVGNLLLWAAKGLANIIGGNWGCASHNPETQARTAPPPPPPSEPEPIKSPLCAGQPRMQVNACESSAGDLTIALAQLYFFSKGEHCNADVIHAIAQDGMVTYWEFTGLLGGQKKERFEPPVSGYATPPTLALSESLYFQILLKWGAPTDSKPDLTYRHLFNYVLELKKGVCEMYDASLTPGQFILYSNMHGARVRCGPHHPINESGSLNDSFRSFDKDGDEKIYRHETSMNEEEFKRFQSELKKFHQLADGSCADESGIDPFEANEVHQDKLKLLHLGKIPCSSDCD